MNGHQTHHTMTSIAVRVKKAAKNRIDRHNQFGLRHSVVPKREKLRAPDKWSEQLDCVHLCINVSGAVAEGTHAESDGRRLTVTVVHAFGAKWSVKNYELVAEIVPSQSVMLITTRKVTLVLKKRVQQNWSKLNEKPAICYEIGGGGGGRKGAFVKTPTREQWAWYDQCAELEDKMMGQIEKKRGKREKAKSWKLREIGDE
ncbi:hypothetical protein niasHS_014245 [Heterodera schachtii]|uniref:CS domain-containing protein n=1 Tax=Heterodera schachtii TaxID=97005 RepID=A0ABD2IB94_HETSC